MLNWGMIGFLYLSFANLVKENYLESSRIAAGFALLLLGLETWKRVACSPFSELEKDCWDVQDLKTFIIWK